MKTGAFPGLVPSGLIHQPDPLVTWVWTAIPNSRNSDAEYILSKESQSIKKIDAIVIYIPLDIISR
jgi:hypothetical protein